MAQVETPERNVSVVRITKITLRQAEIVRILRAHVRDAYMDAELVNMDDIHVSLLWITPPPSSNKTEVVVEINFTTGDCS